MMGRPDMSGVIRQVATPPAAGSPRGQLIAAIETVMTDYDCALPRPVTYSELAAAALTAVEAAEGYALVRLPELGEHDGVTFTHADADLAVTGCLQIRGGVAEPQVEVSIVWDGIDGESGEISATRPTNIGRDFFAAGLAACDHADRWADEHNTAAQDREEGGDRG